MQSSSPGWCYSFWCYVDPADCNVAYSSSTYIPGVPLSYSYQACGNQDAFNPSPPPAPPSPPRTPPPPCPPPRPPTAPPPPPPPAPRAFYFPYVTVTPDASKFGQEVAVEGAYGISFKFTARDADGLPVLRESYENVPRAGQFIATLTRTHENGTQLAGSLQKALLVRTARTFTVGTNNTDAIADEREQFELDMRESHGVFEVIVTLDYLGLHMVTLQGPSRNNPYRMEGFTWEITLYGVCPAGLVADEANRCQCDRGMEPDTSGASICKPCAAGNVKPSVGNEACISCQSLTFELARDGLLAGVDMDRSESKAGAVDIAGCGCRAGTYLHPSGNASNPIATYDADLAKAIAKSCHAPSDSNYLVEAASWVERFNASCCATEKCVEFDEKLCVWQACRMDFVNSVSTRYGECKLCPEFATCSQSATGRRLQSDEDFEARELRWLAVRPGYWRSSQVSITTERCDDYYVCIGSGSSTTQAEWLCAPGHTGPLCASCKPYHYRSNTNLCTECDNRTRTQGLAAFVHVLDMGATQTWLPIMLLLGVAGIVVSFSLLAVLWMCLSSSVASLPIRLFAMCCCACGIKTGTKIASLASQAAVIMPKIKIIISMMQVQEGLVPTFDITLPDMFMNFLATISIWQFNVPLDCFFPVNFHHTLIYRTSTPLVAIVVLAIVMVLARSLRDKMLNWIFFIIFLFYPGCSAIIFRSFSCRLFDDGSRYLKTDLTINCDSEMHQNVLVYSVIMFFIWPVGVPTLYGVMVWKFRRPLRRFHAIEGELVQRKRAFTIQLNQGNKYGRLHRNGDDSGDDDEEEEEEADEVEQEADPDGRSSRHSSARVGIAPLSGAQEIGEAAIAGELGEEASAMDAEVPPEVESIVEDDVVFVQGHLEGEATAKVEETLGSISVDVSDMWGDPNMCLGASEDRRFVQRMWAKSQPTMGLRFEEGDPEYTLMIAETWSNFELHSHLLSENDYTIVQVDRNMEEYQRADTRRKSSVSTEIHDIPIKRLLMNSRVSRQTRNMSVSRLSSGMSLKKATSSQINRTLRTVDQHVTPSVDYSAFELKLNGDEYIIPPREADKEAAVVQAVIGELKTASASRRAARWTKGSLLEAAIEDTKARQAYQSSTVGKDLNVRATRRWYKERVWDAYSPSSSTRASAKAAKGAEIREIEAMLLEKDWRRFSPDQKARLLGPEARLNRPMVGDAIIKVDGYDLRKPETYIVVKPKFVHADLQELMAKKEECISHDGEHYLGPVWLQNATPAQRAEFNWAVWKFIREELTFVKPNDTGANFTAARPMSVDMLCDPPWFATGEAKAELEKVKKADEGLDDRIAKMKLQMATHKASCIEQNCIPSGQWEHAMRKEIAKLEASKSYPELNHGVPARLRALDEQITAMEAKLRTALMPAGPGIMRATIATEKLGLQLEALVSKRQHLLLEAEQLHAYYILHRAGDAYEEKDLVKIHVIREVPVGVHSLLVAARIRVYKTDMVFGTSLTDSICGRRKERNVDPLLRRIGSTILAKPRESYNPRTAFRVPVALPAYMNTLTDQYETSLPAWEIFECVRKVTLVGLLVFFGEGSIVQLTVGLFVCAICLMAYNNVKPYAAWQNDAMQQICQLNIFVTLLSAIVMRVEAEEDPLQMQYTEVALGYFMIFCTGFTAVLAVPLMLLERVEEPAEESRKYVSRVGKVARGARKLAMPTVVSVHPDFQYADELTDERLLPEVEGGVPYKGSRRALRAFLKMKMAALEPSDDSKKPRFDSPSKDSGRLTHKQLPLPSYGKSPSAKSPVSPPDSKFVAKVGFRRVQLPAAQGASNASPTAQGAFAGMMPPVQPSYTENYGDDLQETSEVAIDLERFSRLPPAPPTQSNAPPPTTMPPQDPSFV